MTTIVCYRGGKIQPTARCACGRASYFLCDAPVAKSKTCDVPLCAGCRVSRPGGVDLCSEHALVVGKPKHREASK